MPAAHETAGRLDRLASEFIPVAEQFGLAKLVDHRSLELAIDLLRSMPKVKLALNMSAATATEPQWLHGLEAFVGKGSGLAEHLTIEITETAAISDLEGTAKFVAALKDLGCRVALDDFGAGYTSFPLAASARRRHAKDRRVVHPESRHPGRGRAIRAHADRDCQELRHHHGRRMGRTAKMLENAGVAYMQGYFFGAPELTKPEAAVQPAG